MSNKLRPEFLGLHALNFSVMHNSSSRAIMMGGHFAQHLVVEGLDPKPVVTEADYEMSKYTIATRMPDDGKIIKVIPRYPLGADSDSLTFNPETIVIYEKETDHQIDFFSIPYHHSVDNFFGYPGKQTDAVSMLKSGSNIPKDTVFSETPGVSEDGVYMYGATLNAAFMTVPSVSEDGVIISESALNKFKFKVYETRCVEFGSNTFPLNLYGDADNYKSFPDIGDMIRDDGILMMLRPYDNEMTPVTMSVYDAMEPDYTFDQATYVRGGGGKIVDVKVMCNNNTNRKLPETMSSQLDRYKRAYLRFHRDIIDTDKRLRGEHYRKYGNYDINISPRFHRQIVESLAITNAEADKMKQSLNLNHRMTPLDEYRVEITVEYTIKPCKGYKLTCTHGG